MVLLIASSSNALGMWPATSSAVSAEEGRLPVALTLGANLDRGPVAPS